MSEESKANVLTEGEKQALKSVVEFAAGIYDSMLALSGDKKLALWGASQVMTGALGVTVTLTERPKFEEGAA